MKAVIKFTGITAVLMLICSAESIVDWVVERIPCNAVSLSIGVGVLWLILLIVGLRIAYDEEDWA